MCTYIVLYYIEAMLLHVLWKKIKYLLAVFGCIFVYKVLVSNLQSVTITNYDATLIPLSVHEFPTASRSVLLPMTELKLKNQSDFHHYIKYLSDSDLNELVQSYHVLGLTSTSLQRKFMECPGYILLKHFSNAKGVVQIPKQQQTCKNMSFQSSGTPIALISWPGSGNSWVRQLLETSTGVYTGAIDCDFAYCHAGMIGEGIVSNNVIAVKSHWEPPTWNFTNKVLYIVRNPFDAFVADWNREQASSHVAVANASYFGKCRCSYKLMHYIYVYLIFTLNLVPAALHHCLSYCVNYTCEVFVLLRL